MKKINQRGTNLLLATLISSMAMGCAASTQFEAPIRNEAVTSAAYHGAKNLPSHGVALEGYCPVAYFAVNKPVRGSSDYAAIHDGVTYYMVSDEAKQAFQSNPNKYVPAYGGWCAFGMSVEDKFPVDPTNFKIVDGRLLLFLKNGDIDARHLWDKGSSRDLTAKANKHWKKVQG